MGSNINRDKHENFKRILSARHRLTPLLCNIQQSIEIQPITLIEVNAISAILGLPICAPKIRASILLDTKHTLKNKPAP